MAESVEMNEQSIKNLKQQDRTEVLNHFEEIGFPLVKFDVNTEYDENNRLVSNFEVEDTLSGQVYKIIWHKDDEPTLKQLNDVSILQDSDGNLSMSLNTSKPISFEKKQKNLRFNTEILKVDVRQSVKEEIDFKDFSDLNTPDYKDTNADDPDVSIETQDVRIENLNEVQLIALEELLAESEADLSEEMEAIDDYEKETRLWTFEEVDKLYNKGISKDDKRAFLIWLQGRANKQLKGDFHKAYGTPYPAPTDVVSELLNKNKIYIDFSQRKGERLQPKVIFESGNIWRKWEALENNKDTFLQKFGKKIYENHLNALRKVWEETKDTRLRVDGGSKDMRIVLLPTSEIANQIYVYGYISPVDKTYKKNIGIYTSVSRKGEISQNKFSLPQDKDGNVARASNIVKTKKISLLTAFVNWCYESGGLENATQFGIQWSNKTRNVYDLIFAYLSNSNNPYGSSVEGEERWEREKDDARKVGNRLFAQFLADGLLPSDKNSIEVIWNTIYNFYKDPNLEQVPIGFRYKKFLEGKIFKLRKFNINAVKYYLTRGSVGLAYGVGIGKTFCSIFVMKQAMDLGLAKRPLVIVPNQVYTQFAQEIYLGLGDKYNPMYVQEESESQNLSKYNRRVVRDKKGRLRSIGGKLNMIYNGGGEVNNRKGNNAVNGINLCTYEALPKMIFDEQPLYDRQTKRIKKYWLDQAIKIISQARPDFDKQEILAKILDKNYSQALFGMDDPIKDPILINTTATNYDMVVVDEAHNFNKLFGKVLSALDPSDKKLGREKNPYSSIKETGGQDEGSARALKLFWLSQFIQSKSSMKNTILLSATPFTNNPVQVFSMMTYLDIDMLREAKVDIIKDFFDLFAKVEYAVDFKTDLTLVNRQKLVGWSNIIALQKLIYRVFDKSNREDEDNVVSRPNKIVLPLKKKLIGGKSYTLPKSNQISTTLTLSPFQQELWNNVRLYAQGGEDSINLDEIKNRDTLNTTRYSKATLSKMSDYTDDGLDYSNPEQLDDGSEEGNSSKREAKAIMCLSWGRQLSLNPYLFDWSGYKKNPTAKEYIEASPKLQYTMDCIKSVRDFHIQDKSKISGQVIYMNSGVDTFSLLRDYLVKEIGFDVNEIGIISGAGNFIGTNQFKDKKTIADRFLGFQMNSNTGKREEFSESERVKVLIGSQAIKEGINLQSYGSVLYNVYLDFNPTDQVQIEGRIWRQGNRYDNVRIVVPLMSDCIDVFMFQKLQDKTERINQVWTRDGNANELDTDSFDPSELKYELIKNPQILAQLEKDDLRLKIDEDITKETENFSGLVNTSLLFQNYDLLTRKPFVFDSYDSEFQNNFYVNAYYVLNQLRCDLITKPLFDLGNYKAYLSKLDKANEQTFDFIDFPTPLDLAEYITDNRSEINIPVNMDVFRNSEVDLLSKSEQSTLNGMLNYSSLDLVALMRKLLNEKSVAYPRYMEQGGTLIKWDDKKLTTKLSDVLGSSKSDKIVKGAIRYIFQINIDGELNIQGEDDNWKNGLSYLVNSDLNTIPTKKALQNQLKKIPMWESVLSKMSKKNGVFWNGESNQWFNMSDFATISNYKKFGDKKLNSLGLRSVNDLFATIKKSQDFINELRLRKQAVNTDELSNALVKLAKNNLSNLAKEDFRKGNEISKRLDEFKNSNPDYLGNEMLNVLFNKVKSYDQIVQSIPMVSEEEKSGLRKSDDLLEKELVKVSRNVRKDEIRAIKEEIAELQEYAEEEEGEELKETLQLIEELKIKLN